MAHLEFFNQYSLLIELIYFLIAITSCFLIYFKTKELYELTSYKGIKYFRDTFLFFGISTLMKFFFHLMRVFGINYTLFNPFAVTLFGAAFFAMIYSGSMALMFLIYSIFWKKIDKYLKNRIYLLHIIAIAIAFFSIFKRIPIIFFVSQGGLFLLLIIASWINYRKTRRRGNFSQLYLIYLLIFALWITSNVLEFVAYISPPVGLIIYLASVPLFLIVLFKVLKKLNPK